LDVAGVNIPLLLKEKKSINISRSSTENPRKLPFNPHFLSSQINFRVK